MMGRAAAYDMARSERVQSVTLADNDEARLKQAVEQVNQLAGSDKVTRRPARCRRHRRGARS